MKKENIRKKLIYVVMAVLMLALTLLGFGRLEFAHAATEAGSQILEDLNRDINFNATKYPSNINDYSVQVIQIAVSDKGNLYLYTYQPSGDSKYIKASKINMSQSESVSGTMLYDLKLLDSSSVFFKYEVLKVTTTTSAIQFFNISTIYRPYLSDIDMQAGNKNTINGVAYSVGQLWKVIPQKDSVKYEMKATEVIKIDSQTVGFIRHKDGIYFCDTRKLDSHYLAFSCNRKIDKLLSADIEFKTADYKAFANEKRLSEQVSRKVTLNNYQTAKNDGSGWFGKQEEWHRMASTKDFVKEVSLTDAEKSTLLKYNWILSFYESAYTVDAGTSNLLIAGLLNPFLALLNGVWGSLNSSGTVVSEVALLRLEFDCNGEIYNLGVVSNIQTGDEEPINKTGFNIILYIFEALKKFFAGKGSIIENAVAIAALIACVAVVVLAVKFIRWTLRGLLGSD